jgi:hypothetical protein
MTETSQKLQAEPPVEAIASYFTEMHCQISENLSKNPQGLVCGPIFFTETSHGQKLQFTPYKFYSQQGLSELFIFAQDVLTGEIVGGRKTSLLRFDGRINARGSIFMLPRGIGLAIPTELTHFYILQQEANTQGIPVQYAAVETYHDLSQSVRWEHVWGGTGVLGFTNAPLPRHDFHRCVKEIIPDKTEHAIDLDKYSKITFGRKDEISSGRKKASSVIIETEGLQNLEDYQQKLKNTLVSFFLPALIKQM